MTCIEDLPYEILISNASFKECREYIEQQCPVVYHINPGFKLFKTAIIGTPPVAIGIDDGDIVFPFTKPCHGTFLLKVTDPDEVDRLYRTKRLVKVSKADQST
jgi:hypothetical protein